MDREPGDEEVVALPGATPPPSPAPSRPRGLYGLAMAAMAACIVLFLVTGMLFLTVGWAGQARRIVIALFLFSILGGITSAAIAVIGAAGATYAVRDEHPEDH